MQNQKLIDNLVEAVLKHEHNGYTYDAYCAAKLGASTKAIDLLLKTTIKELLEGGETIDQVKEILKLKPSQKAIDEAFKTFLAKDENADIFKEFKPSQKVIDDTAKYYLQKYEKLRSSDQWEKTAYENQYDDLETATDIASLGASKEIKDRAMRHNVQAYIEEFFDQDDWLVEIAKSFYGDNPAPSEIVDPAVIHELNGGWIAPAIRLSQGLRKKQTFSDEEITNAIKEMSLN